MDRLISERAVINGINWYKCSMSAKQREALCEMVRAIPSAEPKAGWFAKWVATEIFNDMWEYNKDAFAEIACRKLEKLGIVRAKGDEWELVEEQERSE